MNIPIFDQAQPKIIEILLVFLNLHYHAKNQFTPSIKSRDAANFRVL